MSHLQRAVQQTVDTAVKNLKDPTSNSYDIRVGIEVLTANNLLVEEGYLILAIRALEKINQDDKDQMIEAVRPLAKVESDLCIHEFAALALFSENPLAAIHAVSVLRSKESVFAKVLADIATSTMADCMQDKKPVPALTEDSRTRLIQNLENIEGGYQSFKAYVYEILKNPRNNVRAALKALEVLRAFEDTSPEACQGIGNVLRANIENSHAYEIASQLLLDIGTPTAYAHLLAAGSMDHPIANNDPSIFECFTSDEVSRLLPEATEFLLNTALLHPYEDTATAAAKAYSLQGSLKTAELDRLAIALSSPKASVVKSALTAIEGIIPPPAIETALTSIIQNPSFDKETRLSAARSLTAIPHWNNQDTQVAVIRLAQSEEITDRLVAIQCLELQQLEIAKSLLLTLLNPFAKNEDVAFNAIKALSLRDWHSIKNNIAVATASPHASVRTYALDALVTKDFDLALETVALNLTKALEPTQAEPIPEVAISRIFNESLTACAKHSSTAAELLLSRLIQADIPDDVVIFILEEAEKAWSLYEQEISECTELDEYSEDSDLDLAITNELNAAKLEAFINVFTDETVHALDTSREFTFEDEEKQPPQVTSASAEAPATSLPTWKKWGLFVVEALQRAIG